MLDLNYWKQFENTGKVEDYLKYCSCVAQEQNRKENTSVRSAEQEEQSGANPYAGIH